MMRIAVDAMGGDHAPGAIVDGALAAARHLRPRPAARRRARRDRGASSRGIPGADAVDVRILDAPDASRWPSRRRRRCGASRARRSASRPRRCATGEAAALFSAGHTGATVMAAHAAFGMLPGVDRPALATIIPTRAASGGAARRGRHRRVPAAAPAAVRASWAAVVRARRARHASRRASACCRSARKRPRATS